MDIKRAAPRHPERLTIRARIALLVIACIVPAWLLAAVVTYLSYQQQRSNFKQLTLETTRGVVRVVERDLAANVAALQTLAGSGSAERGDLAAFYERAKRTLRYTSGFTIVLSDPSGQQIINLLQPFGSPLPRHGNPQQLQRVLDTRQPVVSDMFIGGVTRKPLVGIEVPVIRNDKVLYGLALGIDTTHLDELLQRQGLPPQWVVSIFDSTGTIVARNRKGEQFVGRKASPALLAGMRAAQEDVIDAPTLEGIPVMAAFSRSPAYGWTVAIGVPEAFLTADLRRALTLYAIGASVLLLVGLGLAAAIARSITRSIHGLTDTARAIGKGEPVPIPTRGLKEADEVRQALLQAQQLLRQQELERFLAEQAEQQMLVAKLAAENANEAKAAFLANVSHELRTPLNAILGFCRLMRDAKDVTPEQTRNLDIINNGGEHLLRLINNLLDMSKIESGRMALEETNFDLHQLLNEIRSLMQVQAVGKGLSLHLVLAPGLPRYVSADAGKLRQVLINLLGNAIKFTGAGAVWLRVDSSPQASAQVARVRFAVEDSGPGIDDKDRDRIFAPFERLVEATGSEVGTGLGLHISKQFVELMGGEIGFDSVPGKSAVFHFELVLRTAGASDGVFAQSDRGRITGLASGQQRYRLLIADDQPENRLLLHALLEPLGFDLREAVNGREAVALAEQWHPHLIWMDIRMPQMDGIESTRRIRASESGAQIRIVALTAHAPEVGRAQALAAGCDDFICKPYRDTEIFDALERCLGVRFLYGERRASTGAGGEGKVSAAQLAGLPPALLEELRQAAVLLDGRHCLELTGKIGAIDDELSARLRRMVGELQFRELLDVLDQTIGMKSA